MATTKGMKKPKPLSQAILRRLLGHWESATSGQKEYGMEWYLIARDAAERLGVEYGYSLSQACGTIAALSPSSAWDRNLMDAESAMRARSAGDRIPATVGTYGQVNRDKASAILAGEPPLEVLGGLKVAAFYRNLMGLEDGAITIDRHAKGAALGIRGDDATTVKGPAEYKWLAEHYRTLARRLGVRPEAFQAVIWVVWRDGR